MKRKPTGPAYRSNEREGWLDLKPHISLEREVTVDERPKPVRLTNDLDPYKS